MKKIFIFIVAVVYLVASAGVTMQRHYCMNRLVGWSLSQQQDDMCNQCGMDKKSKKNNCCNDETIKVKIGDDQQSNFTVIHFEFPVCPVVQGYIAHESLSSDTCLHKYITGHGPPGDPAIPVFLRNKVFRI